MSNDKIKTPCYLVDVNAFKKNISDFRDAVKRYYDNFHIGYSYKTNYYAPFCNAVREMNEYAEIVSPKEYKYANMLCVPDSRIIYNGVIDDFENKLNVAKAGGVVNIENMREFVQFVKYTNLNKENLKIGVRLNFDLGNGNVSRFGFDVESSEFDYILDKSKHPYLDINSVHCHYSCARSLDMFKKRVEISAKYAKLLGAKIVDIGGNMFGRMDESFKMQFAEYVPTFEEYAEAIGTTMAENFPNRDVMLVTEDGTPLCSNAMHLLASILDVKNIRGNKFVVLDTKREDVGASCITKNPSYHHFGKKQNKIDAVVFGCTCVEIDYLIREYQGYANIGDQLLIRNIGAYSLNTTNDFITYGCNQFVNVDDVVVLATDDGTQLVMK